MTLASRIRAVARWIALIGIMAWGTLGIVWWGFFFAGHMLPWQYGIAAWCACFLSFWAKDSGWLDDPPTPEELAALWKRVEELEAHNAKVLRVARR